MPWRASRGWLQPVTSSPCSRRRPVDGGSSPESMLIRVDLPAPLVPMTAWISSQAQGQVHAVHGGQPAEAARQALGRQYGGGFRHAASRLRAWLSAAASAAPSPADPPLPRRRGDRWRSTAGTLTRPARQQRHGHDDEAAHQQLPVLGQRAEPFGQQHERERAQHRAGQAAHAAQDDHQHGTLPDWCHEAISGFTKPYWMA